MRPDASTAVWRIVPGHEEGKGRLPSRGSCLSAYSLPFSDDLTDGAETGVLVPKVGVCDVEVSLCHVRRRMTEKRLYSEGVCS